MRAAPLLISIGPTLPGTPRSQNCIRHVLSASHHFVLAVKNSDNQSAKSKGIALWSLTPAMRNEVVYEHIPSSTGVHSADARPPPAAHRDNYRVLHGHWGTTVNKDDKADRADTKALLRKSKKGAANGMQRASKHTGKCGLKKPKKLKREAGRVAPDDVTLIDALPQIRAAAAQSRKRVKIERLPGWDNMTEDKGTQTIITWCHDDTAYGATYT